MTSVNSPNFLHGLVPHKELSKNEILLWNQLIKILDQLYLRTGGQNDAIEDNDDSESSNENQIAQLYGLVAALDQGVVDLESDSTGQIFDSGFNAVTKNTSYTAIGHDFVNAKGGVTITLPSQPFENDVVIIRNGDGSKIKINANGKTINGSRGGAINRKGTALAIHYFIDTDEWLVR